MNPQILFGKRFRTPNLSIFLLLKLGHYAMNILTKALKVLGVPYTSYYASKVYEEHPFRESMFGLSQIFKHYDVQCYGIRLNEKSEITRLPMPCIMHFPNDFVLTTGVTEDKVDFWWNGNQMNLEKHAFFRQWTGEALLFDETGKAAEPDYAKHQRMQWMQSLTSILPFLCFTALGFIHLLSTATLNICWLALPLSISILMCYITILLLREQMHLGSSVAEILCSSLSHGSCNNVLESNASKLMGYFSWSEIGLGFAAGSVLSMLLYSENIWALLVITACATPYTLWSVWYQWKIARSWCILCLIVQVLLWAQFLTLWIVSVWLDSLHSFDWTSMLQIGLLLLGCILIVHWGVGIITDAMQLPEWKHSYRRLKSNAKVFAAMQESQKQLPTGPFAATAISFGRAGAPHVLTILTNPYCNPCALMHQRLKKVNTSKVRIDYILSSFDVDREKTNKFLIAAYQQLGRDRALAVFDAWFAGGRTQGNDFFATYHLDPETPDVIEQHHLHQQWREKTGIHATPTLLFDGRRFPDEYKLEDLDDLL